MALAIKELKLAPKVISQIVDVSFILRSSDIALNMMRNLSFRVDKNIKRILGAHLNYLLFKDATKGEAMIAVENITHFNRWFP